MSGLSNFLSRRNGVSIPTQLRPIRKDETEAALRLLLGGASGRADDQTILHFLQFALHRRIDLAGTWAVVEDGRIVWAVLPMVSPGRSLLLLSPMVAPSTRYAPQARELIEQVCDHHARAGLHLAQVLLEPGCRTVEALHAQAGFQRLATLLYMQRNLPRTVPMPRLPDGFTLHHYSPQTHSRFAHAIQRSYVGSLDCPGLNGQRDIEDVVAGHKAAGEFEPRNWFLLCERDAERGVLLLSRVHGQSAMELIYLGLVPDARRRGLGDLLMQLALHAVSSAPCDHLLLAVDLANRPALRLYERHGFRRLYVRDVLIRNLRRMPIGSGNGHDDPASPAPAAAPAAKRTSR